MRATAALHRARRLALALALTLGLGLASRPVEAALMLANPPYRPKDFTMVKKDGVFHLFYIRRDVTIPMEQSENDLGHAISTDLYSWTQLPPVLHARPDGWDNLHVWAPSIVERDGVYYMFYTGVSDSAGAYSAWQRTGIATSTDLMNWNRLETPIYSCVQVPWAWCDSTNVNLGFRDPFVMPDPNVPGRWLMYTSMVAAADTTGMIVGVATSDGDFTQWTDLKPLWITNQQYSYNPIVESPHLFKHGNLWYLFFTTNAGQPISYAISFDPTADLNGWVYKGRLSSMLGIDTRTWIASESFVDGTHELFMFVNYNRIEIYEMVWNGDGTFVLYEPGAFHVSGLTWNTPIVAASDIATLTIAATGWSAQTAHLEASELLPGGGEAPIPIDSLGLPADVPLTSDSTVVSWPARVHHASGDTTGSLTFVVRTTDHTASSAAITVTPPTFRILGLSWSGSPVTAGQPETLSIAAQNWSGQTASLDGLELLPGGPVPVSLSALDLPDQVPLTADTTRVPWVARIHHASGDTTGEFHLAIRTQDARMTSPELVIAPRPLQLHAIGWSADSVGDHQPVALRVAANDWAGHVVALQAFDDTLPDQGDSLSLAALGLPDSVALTADTTLVPWNARLLHASGDTTTAITLRVTARDVVVPTTPLRIGPVPVVPPTFGVDGMAWSARSVQAWRNVTLSIAAHLWSGQSVKLAAYEVTARLDTLPLALATLDLPDSVTLDADTTRITWAARIRHADGDTTASIKLVVRSTETTVAPATLVIGGSAGTHDPPRDGPLPEAAIVWSVRMLSRPPVGAAALLLNLSAPAATRIDVFDLQGRRVRNLVDRVLPPGATVVSWDGRNEGGTGMPRGMYFARVVTPMGARNTRLLLLP